MIGVGAAVTDVPGPMCSGCPRFTQPWELETAVSPLLSSAETLLTPDPGIGNYIPFVDVRIVLTGVSSRISSTNLFPEKAAARARALREREDDLGSRSPPRSDC
jgi:hypothetical protein